MSHRIDTDYLGQMYEYMSGARTELGVTLLKQVDYRRDLVSFQGSQIWA